MTVEKQSILIYLDCSKKGVSLLPFFFHFTLLFP